MIKASLQVGGHQLWFELERDGLRQVYFLSQIGQVFSYTATLQPHLAIGLIIMMVVVILLLIYLQMVINSMNMK